MAAPQTINWPHAPLHQLSARGTYIVTAGTYKKAHHFRSRDRLSVLQRGQLSVAQQFGWHLEAWSVFSNHYHFVAHWHNFWETKLTHRNSYLARLNYVHQNPVKHGLVYVANQYPWCSAGWFERTARPAQVKTIYGFKIDKLKVLDDYEVALEE